MSPKLLVLEPQRPPEKNDLCKKSNFQHLYIHQKCILPLHMNDILEVCHMVIENHFQIHQDKNNIT